jgi:hypothetical protein
MRKSGFLAGLVLLGAAAGALAQETEPVAPADQQEEARPEPAKKKIRVLEDPYQLASFYRSRQGGGFFGYGDSAPLGKVSENPYAIAGYYRSRQGTGGYGYSQFWVSGYGGSYGARGRRLGYGRRIGTHGDLFLIAPTILAPIGPLRGFFDLDQ